MRYPPLVGVWDVGARLVATDAKGGVWEWDRERAMPGRPTRVWLNSVAHDIATGWGAYAVLDTDGHVWAMERVSGCRSKSNGLLENQQDGGTSRY